MAEQTALAVPAKPAGRSWLVMLPAALVSIGVIAAGAVAVGATSRQPIPTALSLSGVVDGNVDAPTDVVTSTIGHPVCVNYEDGALCSIVTATGSVPVEVADSYETSNPNGNWSTVELPGRFRLTVRNSSSLEYVGHLSAANTLVTAITTPPTIGGPLQSSDVGPVLTYSRAQIGSGCAQVENGLFVVGPHRATVLCITMGAQMSLVSQRKFVVLSSITMAGLARWESPATASNLTTNVSPGLRAIDANGAGVQGFNATFGVGVADNRRELVVSFDDLVDSTGKSLLVASAATWLRTEIPSRGTVILEVSTHNLATPRASVHELALNASNAVRITALDPFADVVFNCHNSGCAMVRVEGTVLPPTNSIGGCQPKTQRVCIEFVVPPDGRLENMGFAANEVAPRSRVGDGPVIITVTPQDVEPLATSPREGLRIS